MENIFPFIHLAGGSWKAYSRLLNEIVQARRTMEENKAGGKIVVLT